MKPRLFARLQMHKPCTLKPTFIAAAAASLLAAAWQPAMAASQANGIFYTAAPKQIAVRSNGTHYTVPDDPAATLGASVRVSVDAGALWTIKSWSAWLEPRAEHAVMSASWSSDKVSQTYPWGQRPNTFDSRVHIQVSHANLESFVVNHCNSLANNLRSSGLSNAQIFAQDRSYRVGFTVGVSADFNNTYLPPLSEVYAIDYAAGINVVCKAAGGVNPGLNPIGPLSPAPQARLNSMTMDVLHNPNPASCPTTMTVRTTYVSDRAGPFSTRVLSASGLVSQPMMFSMGEADRQGSLYIKVHNQPMQVGQPGDPTRTPTGGPVGGQGVGGGYAPTPGNGNPNGLPPPGPAHPGAGAPTGVATPSDPRLFQGSLWAETLNAASGSVQRSDYAGFSVRCPALAMPGGPGGVVGPTTPTHNPVVPALVRP